MRRKESLFLLLVLLFLLLVPCIYLNRKDTFSVMETIAPTASPAAVATPSPPPPVETPSAEEVRYDGELVACISVEDGYTITDYADFQGEYYDCGVFQLGSCDSIYWEIVVLREETVVDILRIENDEHGDAFPPCKDLVTETDADFDGVNDLLLCLGHFGNQGAVAYKCWLTRGSALTYCPSFTEIANPALDPERKEVLSYWRNMAVSHGYGIYRFLDDAFVMTERLTEQPVNMETEDIIWSWTDEILVDGEWQVREYFTEEDYDEETLLSEKVYGDTAYWDIGSDRWHSL